MSMQASSYNYPIMLKLAGQKCIIVGGGIVAARKLGALANTGAKLTVIALDFCPELLELAEKYKAELIKAAYSPDQLQGALITVAATDSFAVNRQISADAPGLVNNITEPELSSFTVPAQLEIGSIKLTLATGGMPGYTRLLKSYLKQQIPLAFSEFNQFLKEQRQIVKTIPSSPEERTQFWRQTLTLDLIDDLAANNIDQAKEKIIHAVDSFRLKSQNSTC